MSAITTPNNALMLTRHDITMHAWRNTTHTACDASITVTPDDNTFACACALAHGEDALATRRSQAQELTARAAMRGVHSAHRVRSAPLRVRRAACQR